MIDQSEEIECNGEVCHDNQSGILLNNVVYKQIPASISKNSDLSAIFIAWRRISSSNMSIVVCLDIPWFTTTILTSLFLIIAPSVQRH